jgi:hypothetical protein
MSNDPTSTSGSGRCRAYFDAIREAEDDVADALGHIRAEEDAGRITTVEAAAERVGLLERHLERCRQLRAGLGGPS